MSHARLSLCMIARNEELQIAQAIRSVSAVVDEVIVVDTGSTDGTIRIAKSLGASVHQVPWCEDFAAIRNISLDLAQGDWVLVLDADEAIDSRDHATIRALLSDSDKCHLFKQRHYIDHVDASGFRSCSGEYPPWERSHLGYYESWICRLFPRSNVIRFEGIVHELVEPAIERSGRFSLVRAPIPIHHYGHAKSDDARLEKLQRYAALGALKVASAPTARNTYELGALKVRNREYAEGIALLRQSASLDPSNVAAWFSLGGALQRIGRFDDAVAAFNEVLERDPDSADTHANLGLIFLARGELFLAEAHLRRAISVNPDLIAPYGALAELLLRRNQGSAACELLENAIERRDRIDVLKLELARAYLATGRNEAAKGCFAEISDARCDSPRYHYLCAKLRISDRNYSEAARMLQLCRDAMTECGMQALPLFATAGRELEQVRKFLDTVR